MFSSVATDFGSWTTKQATPILSTVGRILILRVVLWSTPELSPYKILYERILGPNIAPIFVITYFSVLKEYRYKFRGSNSAIFIFCQTIFSSRSNFFFF